jgi:N-formylglutamate deformylase
MNKKPYKIVTGTSPLVAAAIHDGHGLRDEVASITALPEPERLREEDPFTGDWTAVGNTRIIGLRSRFEVDLNRPREKAVYLNPEDAWGLHVWEMAPPDEIVVESLRQYDDFYEEIHAVFAKLQDQFKHIVVYDLHTYNHRREGPDASPADPKLNPEVNIGTGTMDRDYWAPLIDRFMNDLAAFDFCGRQLDVRENVKFQGGQFSRWIHQQFPETICSIAIEFKKFFMDEWTGKPDKAQIETIKQALQSTIPGALEELGKLEKSNG